MSDPRKPFLIPSTTDGPVNLTLLADELRSPAERTEAERGVAEVLAHPRLRAALVAYGEAGGPAGSQSADEIYVITAGYGSLHDPQGGTIEVTVGDVLFVPANSLCRFEGTSPLFQTWRLVLPGS